MKTFVPSYLCSARGRVDSEYAQIQETIRHRFPSRRHSLARSMWVSVQNRCRPAALLTGRGVFFTALSFAQRGEQAHALNRLDSRASCRVFEHSARQTRRVKFLPSEAIGLGRNDGLQAVSCNSAKSGQLKVTLTELKLRKRGLSNRRTLCQVAQECSLLNLNCGSLLS